MKYTIIRRLMSHDVARKLPKCLDANWHGMCVFGSDVCLEKLTKIPVFQIFHHHAVWFLTVTSTQDSSDIAIFQSSQNPHVSLEIQPVWKQVSVS